MNKYSDEETKLISILSIISSILSLSGSLFICMMFILFSELRSFAFKVIFFLSFSDILLSVAAFLVTDTDNMKNSNALCQFQSILSTFAGLSSILWTSIIAYIVYQTVNNPLSFKKSLKSYIAFAFGIPTLMAIMYVKIFIFNIYKN